MGITQYFRLVDIQARMILKADASKLTLGYLWWFLEPLMWVAVFYVVFNVIIDAGDRGGAEFLTFLACGKFAFIWFSKTVNQAANSIISSHNLIGKINVPKSLFPMAVAHESLFRQGAVYPLLLVIVLLFGYPPGLAWLWLLPVFVVYYLMIVACSLLGAYLVCLVRDFSQFIQLGMTFLLFTSGIFWDVRALGSPAKTEFILHANPLAFILDAHRQVLMYQTPPDLAVLGAIALASIVMIAVMEILMRYTSQYLALRVLT